MNKLEAIRTVATVGSIIGRGDELTQRGFRNKRRLALALNVLGYDREDAVAIAMDCGYSRRHAADLAEWSEFPAKIKVDAEAEGYAYANDLDKNGYLKGERGYTPEIGLPDADDAEAWAAL